MQELNVTIFGCSLQEVITLEDVTGSLYQTEAASEKNAKRISKRLNVYND